MTKRSYVVDFHNSVEDGSGHDGALASDCETVVDGEEKRRRRRRRGRHTLAPCRHKGGRTESVDEQVDIDEVAFGPSGIC